MLKTSDCLALVVDYQERMMPVIKGREAILKKAQTLLSGLKLLEVPMIITQQYTKGLGSSLPEIFEAAGTEEYLDKTAFSAMGDEAIEKAVFKSDRKDIIVCGVEAHICVLQTCIDLKEKGYNPILVTDCIGSRKKSNVELTKLRAVQEGITLVSTESLLFELMRGAKHPAFREISQLIR